MKNKLFYIIFAVMLSLPMTACGSMEEPANQNAVSSSSDVSSTAEVSDSSESSDADISSEETVVNGPAALDDEAFTKTLDYMDRNLFVKTDDGFTFTGSGKEISSDSVWYSDPFVFYETEDAAQVTPTETYAVFIIDKDSEEVIGMQIIADGEPANGTATGLEACYTEALRNSTPIAMVSWNRGENFGNILCVADGTVISTDGDADKTVNAENFNLNYSTMTPAHPSSPTE